ncbi:MAG: DsbA family protein [Rhodobacteraceae bacterium]|nr:DsbA family protein [Paracoccaceae bacterium]
MCRSLSFLRAVTAALMCGTRPWILAIAVVFSVSACSLQAHDFGSLTVEQRQELGAEIRDYLLSNPEILMQMVEIIENRSQEAAASHAQRQVQVNWEMLQNDGHSWVGGNPDGDISIIEFIDYRCGFCRRAQPDIEEVLARDGNIRFVVKEFPILGQDSLVSAQLALATFRLAGAQKYKLVHDYLISLAPSIGPEVVAEIADLTDLDPVQLLQLAESETIESMIRANHDLANRLGIEGTPAFVIGQRLVKGYIPADSILEIIAQEREAGG